MCRIREPLEHQAECNVPKKRGDFGRGVGVALCRNNVASRPLRQHGRIAINQDDGDFRLAELRKNLQSCPLPLLGRKRTEEYAGYALNNAKVGKSLGGARNCRACTEIGDK